MANELEGPAQRVTIYVGEEEQSQHQALYIAILELLRREGASGATATRGLAGFGARRRIHSARIVSLSADLPVRIEWIDRPDRVEALLPALRGLITSGMITVEEVMVAHQSSGHSADPLSRAVSTIMHTPVIAVTGEIPAHEVLTLLLQQGIRALPVTDRAGAVVGIITDADLLEHTGLHARLSLQGILSDAELGTQLAEIRAQAYSATDIMTPNPIVVHADDSVRTAADLIRGHGLKRLPVVEQDNLLIGMLTRLDILHVLDQAEPTRQESAPRTLRNGRSIAELMNRAVPVVTPGAHLDEIVAALERSQQLRVIVVDSRRHPLGIITDGDLLTRSAAAEKPGLITRLRRLMGGYAGDQSLRQGTSETALDLMTRPVFTVEMDADLMEALHLMLRHQVKRLPVVDADGALVGVLGRADLLRGLVDTSQEAPATP